MKFTFSFLVSVLTLMIIAYFVVKNPLCTQDLHRPAALAEVSYLRQHVEALAHADPPRNFAHADSLDKVAQYITQSFRDSGLDSYLQTVQVEGHDFHNVVAHLGPTEGDVLVIGAHYDVCDDFPGADDNASGVAGLIELARILVPMQKQLKRPIELVAYTLEEPPNFRTKHMGSFVHAKSLESSGKKVALMISLEMIGYYSDKPGSQDYPMDSFKILYPSVGNYIALIARPQEWLPLRQAKSLFTSAADIPVQSANIPPFIPGVDFSDQLNYWELGYPAMMITDTAFMRNHNYHEATDVPENLDYARMSEVVNGIVAIALKF